MTDRLEKPMRLICRCGTIYKLCDMPVEVDAMVKAMNEASCPTCKTDSQTACIYIGHKTAGETDDRAQQ